MKKMMLSLAVACISAATAFADGPTWFANAVDKQQTVGSWTINDTAASLDTLMGANAFITYKDMENDLVFTANTAQTLPGDEATVNTTVKFTAMAMEDFVDLTNANASAWADAKGGLTIIEDPENTYKFYGIVNGTWQELADGSVTAASVISGNVAVPVEVKIWENNGRKISYKVNNAFIGNSEAGLAAAIADDKLTISSIAYRGNCEISSLTGDRADEMWDLIFSTAIANIEKAVLTLKDDSTADLVFKGENNTATYKCAVKNLPKAIAVAPASGYFYFANGDSAGSDSGSASASLNFEGSTETPVEVTLPQNASLAAAVAKIGEDENASVYKTLAAAVTAATAGQTVTAIANTDESVGIGKKLTLAGETSITLGGVFTLNANGELTVKGCTFSNDDPFDFNGGKLALAGGTFSHITKAEASEFCATGFFAEAVVADVSSRVVAGAKDPAVIPGGGSIAYDPNEVSSTDLAKDKTQTKNGFPAWVNYAMGLDDVVNTEEKPNFVKTAADAEKLTILPSKAGRAGTGYVIAMTVKEDKDKEAEDFNGNLPLVAGTYTIKSYLTDGTKVVDVVTKTIGVAQPTVSPDEKTDVKLVTVPYKQIDGSEMTIDEVINKENLEINDTLSIYNGSDYVHYDLLEDEGGARTWVKRAIAGSNDATIPTVKPGQGIWLKTKAENFFQYGLVENAAPVTMVEGWNLLGVKTDTLAVDKIQNAKIGDVIRVEDVEEKLPVEYTYSENGWTYQTTEIVPQEVKNGRTIKLKVTTSHTVESTIPVGGNGVWYVSKPRVSGEDAATIEL